MNNLLIKGVKRPEQSTGGTLGLYTQAQKAWGQVPHAPDLSSTQACRVVALLNTQLQRSPAEPEGRVTIRLWTTLYYCLRMI